MKNSLHADRFKKEDSLEKILNSRRLKEYTRDNISSNNENLISPDISQNSKKNLLKESILEVVEIPSYEPIVLTKSEEVLPEGLSSLCAKGPLFVPVPKYFNWLQLQKGFDKFKNAIRCKLFFSTREINVPVVENIELKRPKQPSSWKPPKSEIPKIYF